MSARVVAIVQARLGSTRLPGKVFADIDGRPVIAHVLDRAMAIHGVWCLVLAVPQPEWLMWRGHLRRLPWGLDVVCGSADDVLDRFSLAAAEHSADVVMRITGDCPLLCPMTAASVLRPVVSGAAAFASNDTRRSGYPDGTDVEVFTRPLLEMAHRAAEGDDREHVTPWMRRYVGPAAWIEQWTPPATALKLSVDTQEDLDRVRRVQAAIRPASLHLSATLAAARKVGVWD